MRRTLAQPDLPVDSGLRQTAQENPHDDCESAQSGSFEGPVTRSGASETNSWGSVASSTWRGLAASNAGPACRARCDLAMRQTALEIAAAWSDQGWDGWKSLRPDTGVRKALRLPLNLPHGIAKDTKNAMSYSRKLAVTVFLALGLLLLSASADILALIFMGMLLASFLRGMGNRLARMLPWGPTPCTVLALFLQVLLTGVICYWLGQRVTAESEEMRRLLPSAWEKLAQHASLVPGGRELLDGLNQSLPSISVLGKMAGAVRSTTQSVADLIVVLALTLFLALQPGIYRRGLLHLLPFGRRQRAEQVLDRLHETLSNWMLARICLMLCTGSLTGLGLWALGIRFPSALGLLLGVLSFIPNIGPAVAALPAALMALLDGPDKVWQMGLLYLVIQTLDGYVLTPWANQSIVNVPPAVGITFQMIMGVLLGVSGLIIASPIAAVVIVLVQMLYVEDVLGDKGVSTTRERD